MPSTPMAAQVLRFSKDPDEQGAIPGDASSIAFLHRLATTGGDISGLIPESRLGEIGQKAVTEWDLDKGSMEDWRRTAEQGLARAAQESDDDGGPKDFPFENASDIHYPLETTACDMFAARAYPELVKGDQVVGCKTFTPSSAPPQVAQAMQERARRIAKYLNYTIFYKMDNWEGETDALLHELPETGNGFKKVYWSERGLASDYVSALRFTVNNETRSLTRCPRSTQDFESYPYEIAQRMRQGRYRTVALPHTDGQDPEAPRSIIEQYRLDDLDGDGLPEPYIATVDVDTRQVLMLQADFTTDDIMVDETAERVVRIDRFSTFAPFLFMPDPRGRYYGIGFARLLAPLAESIDTAINQLMDAGTAQIAGGGFIGANVRLQGAGSGGAVYAQPGEYQMVSTPGVDLRAAIYERTIPNPSQVTFQVLELLLDAAKGISSVKDVITGDAPATAPVGTTLALQNQALQGFSAIWKRVVLGFKTEFHIMYRTLKRYAGPEERREYAEITGGDFDQDFSGDGTDIQPVADPAIVTKIQKMSRNAAIMQLGESQVGQAAGMLQPGPAQEMVKRSLADMDIDHPEAYVAQVPPNPLLIAKAADMQAAAQLKTADAATKGHDAAETAAKTHLTQGRTVVELNRAATETHKLHLEANDITRHGMRPPNPGDAMSAQPPPIDPNNLIQQPSAPASG